MNVATIAAALPGLRPLWPKSADQNQRNRGQARRPDDKTRLSSSYVLTDLQIEADPLPSHLESGIAAQGGTSRGDVGSEAWPLPDSAGIMKTSDVGLQNLTNFEGNWMPERSSVSDRKRSVEDVV